jgi:deoxyadenosine/deoxycytidine kinase
MIGPKEIPTPILISIEGNIGSGKSTLLKRLREAEPSWTFVDEPVDSWLTIRNEKGESLLEVFYKDIKRWAYTFQNAAVLSRGQMIQAAIEEWKEKYEEMVEDLQRYVLKKGSMKSPHPSGIEEPEPPAANRIILMERCVETDRNVFAKMLHGDEKLDGIEWTLYEKWYAFISGMIPKMNAFIWINTEPSVCAQRIKQRGREGEDDISLEYLTHLGEAHEQVFISQDFDEIRNFIKRLDIVKYQT